MLGIRKERMKTLSTDITSDENYSLVLPGPIDTHSIRKLLVTCTRRNGCSKDDVDTRGYWKRIVDTYNDCVIPYPDAKVASA